MKYNGKFKKPSIFDGFKMLEEQIDAFVDQNPKYRAVCKVQGHKIYGRTFPNCPELICQWVKLAAEIGKLRGLPSVFIEKI